MGEIRFQHLERQRVDHALAALLERAYGEGRHILVRASSREIVAALNDRLWTYDDASFLPHGTIGDGDPTSQPIFLTVEIDNPNIATMLVLLTGAATDPRDEVFEHIVRLFDGRDEDAIAEARREWKQLKDEGLSISYWREGDDGGWEKAR